MLCFWAGGQLVARLVPTGQAGHRARETWGQVGGQEVVWWTNFSAFPSFLPHQDGNLQASLRDMPQDQCPLPTSTLPGLHWGNYQGIENAHAGLHVGEQTVGDGETPLSLKSHRPVSGGEMNPGEGVHFSEYSSCRWQQSWLLTHRLAYSWRVC